LKSSQYVSYKKHGKYPINGFVNNHIKSNLHLICYNSLKPDNIIIIKLDCDETIDTMFPLHENNDGDHESIDSLNVKSAVDITQFLLSSNVEEPSFLTPTMKSFFFLNTNSMV
jgi:hypothetical protein